MRQLKNAFLLITVASVLALASAACGEDSKTIALLPVGGGNNVTLQVGQSHVLKVQLTAGPSERTYVDIDPDHTYQSHMTFSPNPVRFEPGVAHAVSVTMTADKETDGLGTKADGWVDIVLKIRDTAISTPFVVRIQKP